MTDTNARSAAVCRETRWPYWKTLRTQRKYMLNHSKLKKLYEKTISSVIISTVHANGLAPLFARTSATMTMLGSCIYTGSTHEWLTRHCYHTKPIAMCFIMSEQDRNQRYFGPFPPYHGMLTGYCVWMIAMTELHAPEAIQCIICAYRHPINNYISHICRKHVLIEQSYIIAQRGFIWGNTRKTRTTGYVPHSGVASR